MQSDPHVTAIPQFRSVKVTQKFHKFWIFTVEKKSIFKSKLRFCRLSSTLFIWKVVYNWPTTGQWILYLLHSKSTIPNMTSCRVVVTFIDQSLSPYVAERCVDVKLVQRHSKESYHLQEFHFSFRKKEISDELVMKIGSISVKQLNLSR